MSELQIVASGAIKLPTFSLTPDADKWIEQALEGSAMIAKVEDEISNNTAVQAAQELKQVMNTLEKARVDITSPALTFQREAKKFFDGKAQDAKDEFFRLTKLVGDYASLQVAKARAAENAKREELTRLEREREAALAQAKNHDERDVVQAHYNERAAIESQITPAAPVVTAKGQSVAMDIEVVVNDIWALSRAHPACVKMEPRMTELKALIRAGVNPPGVTWKEVVKAGIRASSGKTIDV